MGEGSSVLRPTTERRGKDSLRILALQPFAGGSHASFLAGWMNHSRHEWTVLDLPPRHWKWRMRHAAIDFARQTAERWRAGARWDRIWTTDLLNVAEFRGLLPRELRSVPIVVYFHENQLAYPNRVDDPRDLHFAFTNLTTALAADACWFNSAYNRDSLVAGLRDVARQWPDCRPLAEIDGVAVRGKVVPPGVDPVGGIEGDERDPERPLHLVWAARWEHDKGPAGLLELLRRLVAEQVDFRISVLGQSYRETPPELEQVRTEFADRMVRWGFQETREEYSTALEEGDVILSTAEHEFFGLAILEGISAGLVPVLPNRLAYPEVLGRLELARSVLYDDLVGAVAAVASLSRQRTALRQPDARDDQSLRVAEVYGWWNRAPAMDQAIGEVADPRRDSPLD